MRVEGSDCSKVLYTTEREANDVLIKCKRTSLEVRFQNENTTAKNAKDGT